MSSQREEKVDEFIAITGAGRDIASSLLDVCNDNLEMAINMHMEGVQTEEVANNCQPGTSGATAAPLDETDEDGVRAPIPQKQEVLIQPGFEGYALNRNSSMLRQSRVRSVFDGFRNFNAEARNYENGSSRRGKKRTLEELFKPPLDLMFKGDFQSARDSASNAKKWLMINIQDASEFQCQVLNRDVWSNEAVKTILREHFIFWQQYKESEEAQRYVTFYPVSDWPYVAILDPRTGEHMVTWHKLDATTFCDLVSEFLSMHSKSEMTKAQENNEDSVPSTPTEGEPESKRQKSINSILDADEDDQIAAAIQASLRDTQKVEKAVNDSSDDDEETVDYFESFSAENSNSAQSSQVAKSKSSVEKTDSEKHDWQSYLGDKGDPHSSIMIRFPDGNRVTKEIPCSSQFLAITEFVKSEGFSLEIHEIVTNFPRRILTDLDAKQTLKDLGLFPKEIVFVQRK